MPACCQKHVSPECTGDTGRTYAILERNGEPGCITCLPCGVQEGGICPRCQTPYPPGEGPETECSGCRDRATLARIAGEKAARQPKVCPVHGTEIIEGHCAKCQEVISEQRRRVEVLR